jgi:glycosyltransferase involved in cell wall biosynthesis
MKRVLSLSTLYPNAATPRFGTFVARSLEALAAREGWRVTVINPIGVPPLAFGRYRALKAAAVDGLECGVAVFRPRFPLIPKLGGTVNPALIARAVLPLARRLHAQAPFDLVDAQFFYPDGPAAARVARALGLPLSIKARGADIHFWGAKPRARGHILEAAGQASGLLAVCAALADDMAAIGLPRDKITLHYTGLDRDRFRPMHHAQLRRRLARELGIALPDGAPVLATVGALIPRKGQSLVIEALSYLPEATIVLLVGSGPDEPSLRALARERGVGDRVHVLGSLDHDLLPLALSAADAMVLPSASEGLANAWVESLACGTPLVITNAGGAREVITAPEAGRIVARDPLAIAEGVRALLADPPARDDVAALADRFSWPANAAALDDYYRRLLA